MLNLNDILKEVLNESRWKTSGKRVTAQDINHAINTRARVTMQYSDRKGRKWGKNGRLGRATSTRYIEPYVFGLTKRGNPCIRAYQYSGDTYRGNPKWKLFLIKGIKYWKEEGGNFNVTPRENGWKAEEYNRDGDGSMTKIFNMVKFDDSPYDPTKQPNYQTYQNRQQTSEPSNMVADVSTSGAIPNATTNSVANVDRDTLMRNLELTKKEKEQSGYDFTKMPTKANSGPVIPKDGQSIEDARRERKRYRDKMWHRKKRAQQAIDRAANQPIRSNDKYMDDGYESLNDLI